MGKEEFKEALKKQQTKEIQSAIEVEVRKKEKEWYKRREDYGNQGKRVNELKKIVERICRK